MRPEEVRPAIEYDYESHQYYMGLKDINARWVHCISIPVPVSKVEYATYLRELANYVVENEI
jgi:hypothetical protein